MGLGHACCHRADPGRGDELDAHPRDRIDLLQVIDELRQILDRIDVMVRRRRDQRHARRRMAQLGDELGHLEAGQLPAFAGLCALRDLDFDLVAGVEIFRRHAKATAGDLLHPGIGVVAIGIGLIARAVLAAFARHRLGTDAVHRDGQRGVRLGGNRPQRHGAGGEALDDLGRGLDLVDRNRLGRLDLELEQPTQRHVPARLVVDELRVLFVGGEVARTRGVLQLGDRIWRPHVLLAMGAPRVFATDVEHVAHRQVVAVRLSVPADGLLGDFEHADALDPAGRTGEVLVDGRAVDAHRLEQLRAAVAHVGGHAHLGHDLGQPLAHRLDVVGDRLVGR